MTKKLRKPRQKDIEIARSFSYKFNLGNYQSADFFASQKASCKPSEADTVSESIYQFCKKEVARAVSEFKREVDKEKNVIARKTEIKDIARDEAQNDLGI